MNVKKPVTPAITVGDQPTEADLSALKAEGYVGVINLRNAGEPEQPGRYKPVGAPPTKGSSESQMVLDSTTGERWLFKPSSGEAAVPRGQQHGIQQGDYAPRALATAKVAGPARPRIASATGSGRWIQSASGPSGRRPSEACRRSAKASRSARTSGGPWPRTPSRWSAPASRST